MRRESISTDVSTYLGYNIVQGRAYVVYVAIAPLLTWLLGYILFLLPGNQKVPVDGSTFQAVNTAQTQQDTCSSWPKKSYNRDPSLLRSTRNEEHPESEKHEEPHYGSGSHSNSSTLTFTEIERTMQ